jgi:UDP-glucose 4-epimerase
MTASREMKTGEIVGRVVVTGGSGFIGTHAMSKLRERGIEAIALSRSGERANSVQADIADRGAIAKILEPGDVVVHLASSSNPTTSETDRIRDVEENLMGTLQLLEACVERGVSKFVLASSGGTVYGIPQAVPMPETHTTDPISSHGVMKLAMEKYLQVYRAQFGLNYVILRCANAYGPGQTGAQGQGFIGRAILAALRNETLEIWGDGTVVRDFIYVEDVAEAFFLAATTVVASDVVNIGSGRGTSVNEIIDLVRRVTGRPLRAKYTPSRKFDVPANVLDISRASTMLHWKPVTSLQDGIARCYEWAHSRVDRRPLRASHLV